MSSPAFPLLHTHILLKRLLALNPNTGPARHYIYVVGESIQSRHDTDREQPFRQESNFAWLTACEIPGSAFVISYEHESGELIESEIRTHLYLPDIVPEEVMWCGLPKSAEELSKTLNFSSISHGWSPISLFPSTPPRNKSLNTIIHTLPFTLAPPKIVASINGPTSTDRYLKKALHESRRNKTLTEIETMKKINLISSKAHELLMKEVGSARVIDENEAESIFVAYCRKNGAKYQAYTPIVAAGSSASTLHYISNDLPLPSSPSILLVDAGGELNNYSSDITRCIPIGNGGRFTKESKEIYELVLEMQEGAFELIKPGGRYENIQRLMHEILARGFLKLGIFIPSSTLTGRTEEQIVDALIEIGLTNAFYPHGIGHLLGLDTHDVGGEPGKSKELINKYLRLQIPLEENFVITVEPGIYFNQFLFEKFKSSPFVDHEKLAEYWYVGGIRIEDNVLVTKTGFENFTTAAKTIAEVEAITVAAFKANSS